VGYPYIVRVWGDRGYLRGAALQLFTLMYTLGIAVAPFIVEPFLVTLPNNVDTQTCDEVSAPTFNVTRYAGNAVMHDAMMTSQQQQQPLYTTSLTLTNDDITQGFPNSSVLSYQQDVGLARWTFLLACVGDIIASILLAVVCLMSQQTFTSSESRSDNDENASSKLAASVALVCAMFATLFFWASIAGSFTYVPANLRHSRSWLGQVRCFILERYLCCRPDHRSFSRHSTFSIRQPKTSTVNCCIAGSRRRRSVANDDGGLVECRARCRNESRRVRCW
jgi:hypothetical protein